MGAVTLSETDRALVDQYLADWWAWVHEGFGTGQFRKKAFKETEPVPPIAALQAGALDHPDAKVRAHCLGVLDHWANDGSQPTFVAALSDRAVKVRLQALHGMTCERCRSEELCVDDVVPELVRVAVADPNPKVRQNAVPVLLLLAGRDARARAAIQQLAADDPDELVRRNARAAADGRTKEMGSRKAMRKRDRRAAVSETS